MSNKNIFGIVCVSMICVIAIAIAPFVAYGADKLIVVNATTSANGFVVTDASQMGLGVDPPLYTADISAGGVSVSQLHFSLSGTDTGGWLSSLQDNNFFMSSGAAWNNSTGTGGWIQKSSDGNSAIAGSGVIGYRVLLGTGNAVGAHFTPTTVFHIDYAGNFGFGTLANDSYKIYTTSGAVLTTGGVWQNASSRAYKENIRDLSAQAADETLKGLTPVTYDYIANKDEHHVGFIAEDVPSLVASEDRKSLSPMDIVAVLTKVVQEKSQIIDEQKKTLDSLAFKLDKLEAEINKLKSKDMSAQK